MFFWITEKPDLERPGHFEAIENLGEAGFAGRHLILGEKAVIDDIVKNSEVHGLSRKAKAYFCSVKSKYSQVAMVKRSLAKVNVSPDCYTPFKGDEWVVPLEIFKGADSLEKALFLVEHMYDYKVIGGLVAADLREKGLWGWVGFAITPISGGGGGTSLTLSVHQNNRSSLGLCVVDSDKPHVRGSLGSTAKGCLKVYEERWSWGLHVIGARELENLVPPELYAISGVKFDLGDNCNYGESTWGVYGFADTKEGDCLCRFKSITPGDLSYRITQDALKYFPVESGDCPSEQCLLCRPDDVALSSLAERFDFHSLAGLRRIPSRVAALSDLLREVASFGAAPRWSMI